MKVAVVGAGVLGAATADVLASRACEVTLFERDEVPAPDASGTDISKAIRMEYGASTPLYAPLVMRALVAWIELENQVGRRLYEDSGVLFLASTWSEERFERQSAEHLAALGVRVEVLEAKDAAARFPQFAWSGIEAGLFNPRGGWLHASACVEALVARAVERGAQLRTKRPVLELEQLEREYDAVVVCAGAWVKQLLELPVRVSKQHIAHFHVDASGFDGAPVWVHDIVDEGWYGFPTHPSEGVVKVAQHTRGDSVAPDVDRAPPSEFAEAARAFVRAHLPGLDAEARLTTRGCLYTNTQNGDVIVDRAPGRERTFVIGGGSGHAFKLAPTLAELAADLILDDDPFPPLSLGARPDDADEVW